MAISPCVVSINEQQLELVKHGSSDFPVACYHDNLRELPVEWHWHPEFELILVSEGSSLITAGSQKQIVQKGDGIFINSEILHSGFLSGENNCFYHSFVFHPILIGGSFHSVYWNRYVLPLIENKSCECFFLNHNVSWQKELLNALESAWQAAKKETPGYEFILRETLSKLVFSLSSNQNLPQNTPSPKAIRDGERMKQMMQYVAEYFTQAITTKDLAQCAMISESECLRCFHNTIGTTPIQYVKQFRIRKAASLLLSTDRKITDIGTFCGFQDISYFTKSFKETYGCTPSRYRSSVRESEHAKP